MKKKLFALAVLVIILAGTVTGTLAYYTAKTVAHNVITSGEIDIQLVETIIDKTDSDKDGSTTDEVPYPTDPVGGIMPGEDHSKIVRIENVGTNPAWVRMKVVVEINDRKVDLSDEDSVLALDFNNTEWEKKGNYYYYKKALTSQGSAGSETVPLFTTVRFAGEEMDNDYQNAKIEISVQAEGIQYQNNTNYATAWPTGVQILPLLG